MSDEKLSGCVATGCGRTQLELELSPDRAVLRYYSQWMGDTQPSELVLTFRRKECGSHSGVLVLQTAQVPGQPTSVPLPPSPDPLVFEYARVPPQGDDESPWSLLLWLDASSLYDAGTDLPPEEYDPPVAAFAPVVKVLRELERPWKLG